jgi:hypothetical protein
MDQEVRRAMGSSVKTPTRRWLLRGGLAMSVAAPTLLSLLQPGAALADHDDNHNGNQNQNDDHNHPPNTATAHLGSFSSDVVTVAQSASSGDFTSSNAGSDPLVDGRLRLNRKGTTGEGRADVVLQGAAANVSYDVFFQPFNTSKGREALGTIGPTNAEGHLAFRTPNALSGTNRVGIFVITRTGDGSGQAGKDEFVTSLGG